MAEMEGMEDETEVNALLYLESNDSPYIIVGGETGKLGIVDLKRKTTSWVESDFIPAEITSLTLTKDRKVVSVNVDQNVFIYDLVENLKKKSKGVSLKKIESRCLFLDEIIDLKFMNDTHILLASNNEYIKLVCLADNAIEIYKGHTNVILGIDVI
jgi:hypothetical protein